MNATLNNFNQFYTENAIGIILESIENETNTLILLSILNIFGQVLMIGLPIMEIYKLRE
ncbi:hypothetical protein OFS07_15260 [Brachyspira hyodysenteriae]|nr:hypothetical protein [Brachyspira hyodysenteriae]MDA0065084.1 hypothetical protein [Brachyspira hyodysenteriae]MDA0067616.1 hypothetical protein [Brachyspira hyodysenteriae]MDA0073459.1 hypothetical protein [Brachyspira hyodysenteriae]